MILSHIAVGVTVVSVTLYSAMMLLSFRALIARRTHGERRAREARRSAQGWPSVTVFKPLAGEDEDLRENLESFARLDYPAFEILFGVASKADPAYALAQRFVAAHPELAARVLVTDPQAAVNPKVAQLLWLEREAAGRDLRDLRLERPRPPDLPPVARRRAARRTRGPRLQHLLGDSGEQTAGAALENLQLCASVIRAGLLATDAVLTRPLRWASRWRCVGGDLQRVGGFGCIGDVLAEDHCPRAPRFPRRGLRRAARRSRSSRTATSGAPSGR